jgi:signal peptidase I
VKRVIALPGERVRIDDGTVFVNGQPLPEPYVERRQPWNVEEITLAGDEYFVIGDNRGMRARDHMFGAVSRKRLYGRLIF